MRLAVAVFTALIFCIPVVAQNAPSALTVDDVISLYKAGISENVLIVRINQSNKTGVVKCKSFYLNASAASAKWATS